MGNDILKIIIQVNVAEFSLKNEQRRMKLVMLELVLVCWFYLQVTHTQRSIGAVTEVPQ